MAFALATRFDGEIYYIHKNHGDSGFHVKTSKNMNFAKLFMVESDAKRYKRLNSLEEEFQPLFVPLQLKTIQSKREKKKYVPLKERINDIKEDLPAFLKV